MISISILLSLLGLKPRRPPPGPDKRARTTKWPIRLSSIRSHPHGSPPSLHSSHIGVLTIHKHAGTLLSASGHLHRLFLGFTYSPCRAYENQSFPAGLTRLLHLNGNCCSRISQPVLLCLPSHKLSFLLVYCLPPKLEYNAQVSSNSL